MVLDASGHIQQLWAIRSDIYPEIVCAMTKGIVSIPIRYFVSQFFIHTALSYTSSPEIECAVLFPLHLHPLV